MCQVLYCVSPEFLDDVDVAEIDAGGSGGVDDLHDGVDAHGREQAGVLRHHLRAERGGGAVQKRLFVAELHRLTDGGQDLHPFLNGLLEGLGNDGRVDPWQERKDHVEFAIINKHQYDIYRIMRNGQRAFKDLSTV